MTEPAESFQSILRLHSQEPRELLNILEDFQSRYRCLPEDALRGAAKYLSLPLSRVFAVASFYKALSLQPKGEKLIRVCCGTACHLRGAPLLIEALEEKLKVKLGETEKNQRFTYESVNCLGACALAPVVTIDDAVYGKLTPNTAKELEI
jgi:NADH-quinone oxidoreductase subunit E